MGAEEFPMRASASLLLGAVLAAAPASATSPLAPCPRIEGARCGALTVFEDRAAGQGRTIDLASVVFPAKSDAPKAPIFFLVGGPGESATDVAPFVKDSPLARFLVDRALVLVDQRGTGRSNQLQCAPPATPTGYFGHVLDPEQVAECRVELERKSNLALYTTSIAMDDLDDVRAWLGYDMIVLWGGSYGTRAAMEYMRRHGSHVEGAILDAVAGFDALMPLSYAYDAQRAFDRVASDCAADSGCAAAYPDLERSLAVVLDRFREGPIEVSIRPGRDAAPVTVPYAIGDFGYTIRGMLYSPRQTARLPKLLTAAAGSKGDLQPFAQAYFDRAVLLGGAVANGLYLSVLCTEDVPYIADDAVLRWTAGTYLGTYLVDDYREACNLWVRGTTPPDYHRPLSSNVPTLVFSGGRDPVTSPRWGEEVVRHLPNGRHILFPDGGHGATMTPCGLRLIGDFLAGTAPRDLDTACTVEPGSRTSFELPETPATR
jgi:pimeloyl-ACP methyl ester carboxylesterase